MRQKKRRGNVLIEFSLMLACFWLPMFLGTYAVGFNLLRQLEVIQFCRDAGHLWTTSTVDLSADNVMTILKDVGAGTGFPDRAQVIFSQLIYVDAATCLLGDNMAVCPNHDHWCYTQYLVLGTAPSLGSGPGKVSYHSLLTAPSGGTPGADGSYSLHDTTTVAGLRLDATLPGNLGQIVAYNAADNSTLPSGQTVNLVQVGAAPFNVPGVTSLLALSDYAVF